MANETAAFTDQRMAEAGRLLEKSEEELLQALIDSDAEHAFPDDPMRWARDKFEAFKARNRKTICLNAAVRSVYADESNNRRAMLVCAIADACGGGGFVTISALLVKEGLDVYCEECWTRE